MAFAHSIGQNFFKDLLHYTNDKTQTDKDSIQTDYELQKRLSDFWKNNDKPTLLKSQKYSGEVLLNKAVPLGGPLNLSEECQDEFPYWSIGGNQTNSDIINENENENENDNENDNSDINNNVNENTKEHFTQNIYGVKENFNGNTTTVIIVVILIILLLSIMFFIRKI